MPDFWLKTRAEEHRTFKKGCYWFEISSNKTNIVSNVITALQLTKCRPWTAREDHCQGNTHLVRWLSTHSCRGCPRWQRTATDTSPAPFLPHRQRKSSLYLPAACKIPGHRNSPVCVKAFTLLQWDQQWCVWLERVTGWFSWNSGNWLS